MRAVLLPLICLLAYVLGCCLIPPLFKNSSWNSREPQQTIGASERVCVIDDNMEALIWRLRMIREAQNEIILVTFELRDDTSGTAAAMVMNTRAAGFPLYRAVPLSLKCMILRLAHRIFGERNSCISISNLGVISLPKDMDDFIESMDFMLTPRIQSSYNCGVVSYNGIISVSFSRICKEAELENVFLKNTSALYTLPVAFMRFAIWSRLPLIFRVCSCNPASKNNQCHF